MRKHLMPGVSWAALAAGQAAARQMGVRVVNDAGASEEQLKAVVAEMKRIGEELQRHGEAAIKARGELSADVKNQVDQLLTKHTEVAAKLDETKKAIEGRLGQVEQELVRRPGPSNDGRGKKTVGQIVAESDKLKAFIADKTRGRCNIEVSNAMLSSDLGAGILEPQRDAALPRLRSRLFIRDLISKGRTTAASIQYVRQTGFTNNAAVVSEGARKPESTIAYDLVTVNVATIAHFFKASKQILDDMAQLQSDIDVELRYGLKQAEENEILFGDGTGIHMHGIVPQASAFNPAFTPASRTLIDDIRLAMLQAQLAKLPATGIALHMTDWARIETTKDSTGQYIFANPLRLSEPNLWGLPIASTDLTAMEDHFLVGGFQVGAMLYDREDANVQIATENEDDFVKNLITIRGEERAALAVKRPEAFVWGTFYQVSGS